MPSLAWPAAVRPRSVITVPLVPKLVSILPGAPPAANAGWVTPAETSGASIAAAARMPFTDMRILSFATARAVRARTSERDHRAEFVAVQIHACDRRHSSDAEHAETQTLRPHQRRSGSAAVPLNGVVTGERNQKESADRVSLWR